MCGALKTSDADAAGRTAIERPDSRTRLRGPQAGQFGSEAIAPQLADAKRTSKGSRDGQVVREVDQSVRNPE